MFTKKEARMRRAKQTRAKISEVRALRLCVHRSNLHIYAQVIDATGGQVLAAASTNEADVKSQVKRGSTVEAARIVGQRIAEKAKAKGVSQVAFDRSGFRYHGRVKALADAAREAGLQF
jgi:large subunit ribosomal protein L18